MKIKLTYLQAYNAMYRFIDTYYWRMMPIEEIAGLLGNMSFFNNNGPMDQAIWNNWLKIITKIPHQGEMFTKPQAFETMVKFIEYYCDHMGSPKDLQALIEYVHQMKKNSEHTSWNDWNKYLKQILIEEHSRNYILVMGKNNILMVRSKMPYLNAYNAMPFFLKIYNEHIASYNFSSILHQMSYLKTKKTVDTNAWKTWIKCAQKIESEKNQLTYLQTFDVMILFLQTYPPHTESIQTLLRFLNDIKHDQHHLNWKSLLTCIDYAIPEYDSCIYVE